MVRLYSHDSDYPEVKTWYQKQEFPELPEGLLSPVGFIVPGFCAGWVMRTDAKVAILEPLIGNPDSDKEERSKAIDSLIETMLAYSKLVAGADYAFVVSKHEKLAERGKKHGFFELSRNQKLFLRKL